MSKYSKQDLDSYILLIIKIIKTEFPDLQFNLLEFNYLQIKPPAEKFYYKLDKMTIDGIGIEPLKLKRMLKSILLILESRHKYCSAENISDIGVKLTKDQFYNVSVAIETCKRITLTCNKKFTIHHKEISEKPEWNFVKLHYHFRDNSLTIPSNQISDRLKSVVKALIYTMRSRYEMDHNIHCWANTGSVKIENHEDFNIETSEDAVLIKKEILNEKINLLNQFMNP